MNIEDRFLILRNILSQKIDITDKEEQYLKWICKWDVETFEVFKNIFLKLIESGDTIPWRENHEQRI